ncbi:MAG TPA: transcription repressor NadR [Clostridia bacterium]|nr:transcription repressor NadR [Clostridia bacterium]
MDAEARRTAILEWLRSTAHPITGTEMASKMKVSRQVIVQDIALLRAAGHPIIATPQGYTVSVPSPSPGITRLIATKHGREEVEDELMTIVQEGVSVIDVIVEHPIYGQLTGALYLDDPSDVKEFMRRLSESGAKLLSSLTEGVHLHTVRAVDNEAIERAERELSKKGYLLK